MVVNYQYENAKNKRKKVGKEVISSHTHNKPNRYYEFYEPQKRKGNCQKSYDKVHLS